MASDTIDNLIAAITLLRSAIHIAQDEQSETITISPQLSDALAAVGKRPSSSLSQAANLLLDLIDALRQAVKEELEAIVSPNDLPDDTQSTMSEPASVASQSDLTQQVTNIPSEGIKSRFHDLGNTSELRSPPARKP